MTGWSGIHTLAMWWSWHGFTGWYYNIHVVFPAAIYTRQTSVGEAPSSPCCSHHKEEGSVRNVVIAGNTKVFVAFLLISGKQSVWANQWTDFKMLHSMDSRNVKATPKWSLKWDFSLLADFECLCVCMRKMEGGWTTLVTWQFYLTIDFALVSGADPGCG